MPLLLLVPDASAVGYLRGPRLGRARPTTSSTTGRSALAVLGLGLCAGVVPVIAGRRAILIAHVGMDRAAGYGLKLPTSFQDTHLGRIGKAR